MIKVYVERTKEGENPSWAVRSLLVRELKEVYGICLPEGSIRKDEKGKPFLAGYPDLHISLSHTVSYIACAFGDKPVGIDIEKWKTHPRWQKIVEKMHPREQEKIKELCGGSLSLETKEPVADFCDLWVRKESFLKAIGEGLRLPLDSFDITGKEVGQSLRDGVWYLKSRKFYEEGFSLAVCAQENLENDLEVRSGI